VIAITASVMQDSLREVMAAGFDGYIEQADQRARLPGEGAHGAGGAARVNSPAKILVVDDTPQNVKLLADLLQAKGYAVVTAADGEAALARLAQEAPDLVLLDVMMPGLTGYEVCRRMREEPATALLPVVLVTALDPQQERVKGIEAGADDFLSKPINQQELLRARALAAAHRRAGTARSSSACAEQVAQLERLGRLKRFFSPQLAEAIVTGGADDPLRRTAAR
jgi:adenylate cyclase